MDSAAPPVHAPLMSGPPVSAQCENAPQAAIVESGFGFECSKLIGVMVNWWLHGILVMQYIMYCSGPIRDSKMLRAIVHLLFLLDTVETLMTMDDIFFWYSNCFMVLLNQRIYYNTHETATEVVETLDFASHRSREITSNNLNSSSGRSFAATQITVIQFTETRTDGPLGAEMGDVHDVKDGQVLKSARNSLV
ncbi:hypothetical protein D9756_009068 [Leucocoprinus leucothites]|uniref:Uncharacterized protein n=1 Tax=Leucocoprinus leucothites TaxID=201217 RepID=A0A8H5D0I5_9AGAR|nr:hypothetical protein D9756_009068 [Leucoagaricus leucothites]